MGSIYQPQPWNIIQPSTYFFLPYCFTTHNQCSAWVGPGQLFFSYGILPALHQILVSGEMGIHHLWLGLPGEYNGRLRSGTRAPCLWQRSSPSSTPLILPEDQPVFCNHWITCLDQGRLGNSAFSPSPSSSLLVTPTHFYLAPKVCDCTWGLELTHLFLILFSAFLLVSFRALDTK